MNVFEMTLALYRFIRVGRTLTESKSLKLRRCIAVYDRNCCGIRIKQLSNFETIDLKKIEDKSKKSLNVIKTFIICQYKML